jgi:hypothetical protein
VHLHLAAPNGQSAARKPLEPLPEPILIANTSIARMRKSQLALHTLIYRFRLFAKDRVLRPNTRPIMGNRVNAAQSLLYGATIRFFLSNLSLTQACSVSYSGYPASDKIKPRNEQSGSYC